MKNLIFTLSILFSTIGFGQDYIPIFEGYDSVRWNNLFGGTSWGGVTWFNTFSSGSDSIVNDSGVDYWAYKYKNKHLLDGKTILVREDTAAQKVYAKMADSVNEYLIYDFTLKAGDGFDLYTLNHFSYDFNFFCSYEVESVEYKEYFGKMRKTINIQWISNHRCNYLQFIEGIGSVYGFEYFFEEYFAADTYSPTVLCAFKNGEKVFGDSICFKELIPTNVAKIETEKRFKISPNPVDNQLVIKTDSQNFLSGKAKITNLSGQVLFEKEVHFQKEIRIEEVEKLRPGIYFVSLETKEGVVVRKFIKN